LRETESDEKSISITRGGNLQRFSENHGGGFRKLSIRIGKKKWDPGASLPHLERGRGAFREQGGKRRKKNKFLLSQGKGAGGIAISQRGNPTLRDPSAGGNT